jgi:hypothetical protein
LLPEQTADPQGFAHTLPHAMVIPGDVLFEHRTVQSLDLMHGLDEAAAQQLGQLLRVEVVILVSFLGDQTIASRLADDHALHSFVQIAPQPAGQRAFLNDQRPWLRDFFDHRQQRGNAGVTTIAQHHVSARIDDGNFAKLAMGPAEQIVVLRSYLRQRQMLIRYAGQHVQHMQKALEQMNVKLTEVVSDISGLTGMSIIRAILNGERNPLELAKLRNVNCKRTQAEIARALYGNWRVEHLFALQQAVTLYDCYREQLRVCDEQMQRYLATDDLVAPALGVRTHKRA